MFYLFKKKNFNTKIFVAASLINLVLLMLVFAVVNIDFVSQKDLRNKKARQILIDRNYNMDDPFITKSLNSKDFLVSPIFKESDPKLGSDKPKINIFYFSDFGCEYCHKQELVLKSVLEKYKNDLRIIWKDYPEPYLESKSFQAAIAARCADEQGKFWEYHDLLYQAGDLNKKEFISLATTLGLRVGVFEECLIDEEISTLIKDSIKEAHNLDIVGIPFVFINNEQVMGELSYEELEKIIKKEISLDKK